MGKASRKRRERMEQVQQARGVFDLQSRGRLYPILRPALSREYQSLPVFAVDSFRDRVFTDGTQTSELCRKYGVNSILPFAALWLEMLNFTGDDLGWHLGALVNLIENPETEPDERYLLVIRTYRFEGLKILKSPVQRQVYLSEKGAFLDFVTFNPDTGDEVRTSEGIILATTALNVATVCALALGSFLNCRNIVTVDHEPDPVDNAAYQRHFGVPMTKYKTLAVKSMGKRYERDGEQQQFDVMPLHIRRGNFAHYTDDKPLFGKYTGTFWRPATAVGNAKNGVVVKDYKVAS